jgi:hypothetical protein
MVEKNSGLLEDLTAGLRDDGSTTSSLLQKCILLGGQVGSEGLRDWARRELRGYGQDEDVPDYRRVTGQLCVDRVIPAGIITGQVISTLTLPEFARERVTGEVLLTHGVGELEALSRAADEMVKFAPFREPELVALWNNERPANDKVTAVYSQVSRASLANVVIGVRTALAELVGELLATAGGGERPTKQAADNAVHVVVTGNRNTVNVVGSQETTNGNSSVTATGSADQPPPVQDGWWMRWRSAGCSSVWPRWSVAWRALASGWGGRPGRTGCPSGDRQLLSSSGETSCVLADHSAEAAAGRGEVVLGDPELAGEFVERAGQRGVVVLVAHVGLGELINPASQGLAGLRFELVSESFAQSGFEPSQFFAERPVVLADEFEVGA